MVCLVKILKFHVINKYCQLSITKSTFYKTSKPLLFWFILTIINTFISSTHSRACTISLIQQIYNSIINCKYKPQVLIVKILNDINSWKVDRYFKYFTVTDFKTPLRFINGIYLHPYVTSTFKHKNVNLNCHLF